MRADPKRGGERGEVAHTWRTERRAPRVYRGKDIEWWMDAAGVLDERYDEIDDIARARRVPSLQLAGTPDRSTLDLNALTDIGVTLAGRFAGLADGKAQFAGSLRNVCALSDLKMGRLLEAIDTWAHDQGLDSVVEPPHRLPATRVADSPPLILDLAKNDIRTIIWATGYRPDYKWLEVPVLDHKGLIRHDGGITTSPGLYLMGMPFMRRRKSTLIDGAGDDARELSAHLASYVDARMRRSVALEHARSRPASEVRDTQQQPLTRTSEAKGTGNSMNPVPLFDLKCLVGFAATVVGTSNRRH